MTHVESFKRPPQVYAQGCSGSLGNMAVQGEWCMPGRRHIPLGVLACSMRLLPVVRRGCYKV
jgi:hypothetical protein